MSDHDEKYGPCPGETIFSWQGYGPAATPQPLPTGEGRPVLPEVIEDLKQRSEVGKRKYNTELRSNNGRDALMDAYQEALDFVMYLKQAIMDLEDRA